MRIFAIFYCGEYVIHTLPQFKNFIKVAVIQNQDIRDFSVLELDERLTSDQAINLGYFFNIDEEIVKLIDKEVEPIKAFKQAYEDEFGRISE